MKRALILAAAVVLLASSTFAQQPPAASYTDDFESYGLHANPAGWIDTSVGTARPEAAGLYKTWPDPTASFNVVYGTKQSSGKPEGNNPRIGTFSTLSTKTFAGQGRLEYRGRMLRTNSDTRIGLTFFSSYPDVDKYYLIGLWSQPTGTDLTLQLFGFGAGTPAGTLDSNVTLTVNKWYRFFIQVDDVNGGTTIKARFWRDGDPEPATFSINATDTGAARLRSGRIGIWSAVRGDAYFDNFSARSPVDTNPPVIQFFESGTPLPLDTKFNRNVTPEIRVTDDTPGFTYTAKLDGVPYTSLTPVTTEGVHTVTVHAVDTSGNASDATTRFLIDKTAPVVALLESGQPFPANFSFNRDVIATANVTDISQTIVTATLDGQPSDLTLPITTAGSHTLSVTAVDEVEWSTTASVSFAIDKSGPVLTFTSHHNGDVLTTPQIVVKGGSDDAVTVVVAGAAATIDGTAHTFTTNPVALLEGSNTIVATGTDRAGNVGTATVTLVLDTRAPDLALTAPAAGVCLDTSALQVSGTAADPHLTSVKVTVGSAAPVVAPVAANGTWTVTIPVPDQGQKLITVEAIDDFGHNTSLSRTVSVDRTTPVVDVRDSGNPFTSTLINRSVALFLHATDADSNVTLTATLDGTPYTSGTQIAGEGHHTLAVIATDCAGHKAQPSFDFTIDLTPPTIRNLSPANDATVGTAPASITGLTDTDAAKVEIAGSALSVTPAADGTFTIASVPFAEGTNRYTLLATDRAGNRSSVDYSVTVRTTAPTVEIRESGATIAPATLFNRAVTPVVRSNDPQATLSATLNGVAYVSGTTISNDGGYTLHATATDTLGHSASTDATFTIDRTPPVVKITSPAAGTIQSDHVQVRGTAGDSVAVTVNGQPVTPAGDGSFVLDNVLLDPGPNAIVATGVDRAGNAGRDEVLVTRDDVGAGMLLTYPPDHSLTNRPATDVVGRILTPAHPATVKIGTASVPVDPTGGFRASGYALVEGDNTITATATAANGIQTTASTHVTADFTPPALSILESGQPVADGARFATQAVITLQASDARSAPVTTTLTADGTAVTTLPLTLATAGGHSLIATARDLAGNETRVERTIFIGVTTGGTADCKLDSFDPSNGSVVLAHTAALVGRSGGALGVKVNGVAAVVADGSFAATVELPNEGPNNVTITCTDANGAPTGTPATIVLQRVTGDPSITIDAPAEGFVVATEAIAVSGTVGPGVVSADVNGVAATITGSDPTVARPYNVPAVRLAAGLNVLIAHGRNAAGRIATASRRGVYVKDAPTISISAPPSATTTGAATITVSGTYTNLDPATLTLTNVGNANQSAPVQVTRFSDTTGSFVATDVPVISGDQTIRASGADRLNRTVNVSVVVTRVTGTPSITITQPADHAYFPGGNDSVTVTGSFSAAAGSTVDVNGVTATLTGATYSVPVKFSTLAGGITPIVARVTEPGGAGAFATVVVTQIAAAPTVLESFPAPGAAEVDPGALLLVLFSQPMNGATLSSGALRVEDASGAPVSGTLFVDKDVATFAPATLLTVGARYTLRVTTGAKNLAGTALAAEYTSSFTVATSAPSTAPLLNPVTAVCGAQLTVSGTAVPGARVRLDSGTLTLNGAADTTGKFSFTYPLSGQSGYALVRVRVVGSDGSLSPAAEAEVRVDCSGPQVLNATFDRTVNKLTIQFSEPVAAASATVGGSAILLTLDDGRAIGGSVTVAQNLATVTPSENLTAQSFNLTVGTAVTDVIGNHLVSAYSQSFAISGGQPTAGDGSGFISGEVFDATTGRPLAGASISIDLPSSAPVTTSTDARGRYLARLPEGAHTIRAAVSGYMSVWRQIIVPAGTGVVPIDIRLTSRGTPKTSNGSAIALTHGGDTSVTKKVDLAVPASALATGHTVALTAAGAQALTGLLPLGWSPLAAAEVVVDGSDNATPLAGAQLTFHVNAADVTAAAQNLTAAQYDAARDEWRVLAAVANVAADGSVNVPLTTSGAFVLAYPDKAAGLTAPPLPVSGDVLRGVPAADPNAPALVRRDFTLNPGIVLPSGRTVATLRIEGSGGATYPSGTAVQAYIDEELRLADGSTLLDPPFATDLLLYRTLTGDLGTADFHLAPSAKAAQVVLDVGFDHIRIQPYPGRLDRGTLIGSEGGRVPADDKVAVEIPTGAVPEPLRATATSLTSSDLASVGNIAGFKVVGGFTFSLQRATQPAPLDLDGDGQPDAVPPVELFVPARATFTVDAAQLPSAGAQVILGELLGQTPFGAVVRLAAPMMAVDPSQTSTPALRFTTRSIDRSILPVDGVVHEGRYVVLAAQSPIAFATGIVRLLAASGRLLADARVLAPPLGVADVSRANGIYNVPVPARPAAPFTLIPRHTSTGDGAAFVNTTNVDPDSVTRVDLALVPQPPVLGSVVVLRGDPPSQASLSAGVTTDVALTTNIRASFSPSIDPSSVTAGSITVTDATTGAKVNGSAAADGTVAVVWTLAAGQRLNANSRYVVAISTSIRGTNGALLARAASYTFATVQQLLNAEVHRERIRITIPDVNGVSIITGDPGALPAGWQAVAVRRHHDFIVRYQATAAGDGSFSFSLGNGGDPADKITIGDLIDLQAVNTTGNVTAIFSLTPFVTADGKGFVVPANTAVRYTTPEGITLDVPAGAFDVPTIVTVSAAQKADFLDIDQLEAENEYISSVHVDFDGDAKKPLNLEVPIPAGFDTSGKQFILAEKGMSVRGPRLAVVDLLRVQNGKLTTDGAASGQSRFTVQSNRTPGANQTLTGSQFSKYLTHLIRGGMYMTLDIRQPVGSSVGWAVMDGLQAGYDLIWDTFWSYFVPHIAITERGGALLPIITGKKFTVSGSPSVAATGTGTGRRCGW